MLLLYDERRSDRRPISGDRATTDAARIGSDGNSPTMRITWLSSPHFFRAERVIVLYVGVDQAAIDLLTALLGPPFVG